MSAPQSSSAGAGWPLLAILGGYPVLWLLGLKLFAWPLMALLLAGWLVTHRARLRAPVGVGLWLLFIAWTLLSALTLTDVGRLASWGYREGFYLSATVVLVFLANVSPAELPTRRLTAAVSALFASAVVLGTLGLFIPDVEIPTLAEAVLPKSLTDIQFVSDQVRARFAGQAEFIGAVRPSVPFGYTNEWGAALGVMLPMVVYATHLIRSTFRRRLMWAIIAFSVVPIIVSVNRGLWVSVVVALLVVLSRAALARHVGVVVGVSAATLVGVVVVMATPLSDVIVHRFDRPNLGTRETLVSNALQLATDAPLFGHGAPVEIASLADANSVAVGTHGQLWTLLVSQGIPGMLFYLGFFAVALAMTWRVRGWAVWLWAAVVVSVVQVPFYNSLPMPLVLAMVALALLWREYDAQRSRALKARAARTDAGTGESVSEHALYEGLRR